MPHPLQGAKESPSLFAQIHARRRDAEYRVRNAATQFTVAFELRLIKPLIGGRLVGKTGVRTPPLLKSSSNPPRIVGNPSLVPNQRWSRLGSLKSSSGRTQTVATAATSSHTACRMDTFH